MAAEVSKPDFNFQWASGGAIVAPSDVKIQTGWTAEVPPFQWENYLQNRQDNGLLHLFQKGISEWDAASNYYFTASGTRSYVQGSDGTIYVSVQDSIGQNPTTDASNTYWEKAFKSGTLLTKKVFTSNGTYTPTPGTKSIIIEMVGGGGGGGGAASTAAGQLSLGGGGGGGAFLRTKLITVPSGSQTVNIGVGGTAGAASGGVGGTGGTTSFGSLFSAAGGLGGSSVGPSSSFPFLANPGGAQGTVTGSAADIEFTSLGEAGDYGMALSVTWYLSGRGGASFLSGGAFGLASTAGNPGSYGSGGSAAARAVSTVGATGGVGGGGILVVWEFA